MQTVAQQLAKEYPDSNNGLGVTDLRRVIPLSEKYVAFYSSCSAAPATSVNCAVNVTNLVLVRAERRKRETAVRSALGASTARLLRQFVIEALVLVFAGSFLAVWAAYLGMSLLIKLIPVQQMEGMPYLLNLGLNPRVRAFAGLLSLLATALIALLPALRLQRRDLRGDLANGACGAAGNAWRRLGPRLIVLELATAVVLLVGAGLLAKSFYLLLHVDLGFKPDHLATIIVEAPKSYADGDRLMLLERQILRQIGGLPGVHSAAISSHLPVRNWDGGVWIVVPGRPSTGERNDLPERDVSFGYLEHWAHACWADATSLKTKTTETSAASLSSTIRWLSSCFPVKTPSAGTLRTRAEKKTLEIWRNRRRQGRPIGLGQPSGDLRSFQPGLLSIVLHRRANLPGGTILASNHRRRRSSD